LETAQDPRVESDQMAAALKSTAFPIEYLVKENKRHGSHNAVEPF
jgi:hypothetical protein